MTPLHRCRPMLQSTMCSSWMWCFTGILSSQQCSAAQLQKGCQTTALLRFPHASVRTAVQSMELQRLGIENIPGQESARVVHLNPPEGAVDRSYSSNSVHTAK